MDEFVADTHALIWYFTDSKRLGRGASRAFQAADLGQAIIHIPVIALAEIYYANVKLGFPIDFRLFGSRNDTNLWRKLGQTYYR